MRVRTILIMASLVVALGVAFFVTRRPPASQPQPPQSFIWSVDTGTLSRISIRLPRVGKSESWVKHEDQYWYFDRPKGPRVDMKRWGGGVPLLLSGPRASRLIAENASESQFETYGLASPQMRIELALQDKKTIAIEVGDETPDNQACYIRVMSSRDVYTVDLTWCEVLERLVLDPPYPRAPDLEKES